MNPAHSDPVVHSHPENVFKKFAFPVTSSTRTQRLSTRGIPLTPVLPPFLSSHVYLVLAGQPRLLAAFHMVFPYNSYNVVKRKQE